VASYYSNVFEIAEHIQTVRAAAKRLEKEAKNEIEKAKKELEGLILE
jgi:transcriptional regulator